MALHRHHQIFRQALLPAHLVMSKTFYILLILAFGPALLVVLEFAIRRESRAIRKTLKKIRSTGKTYEIHMSNENPLPRAGKAPVPDDNPIQPKHYRAHPSGIECIEIARHMPFNIGNAIKYLWRSGLKRESPQESQIAAAIRDLEKAKWYIDDQIQLLRDEKRGLQCESTD